MHVRISNETIMLIVYRWKGREGIVNNNGCGSHTQKIITFSAFTVFVLSLYTCNSTNIATYFLTQSQLYMPYVYGYQRPTTEMNECFLPLSSALFWLFHPKLPA